MSEATAKKSSRFGLLTWLIVGGLVLINMAVFFGSDKHDPQAVRRFFHAFNPYHWPVWYAVNLWIVFFGWIIMTLLKQQRIQKSLQTFYASNGWRSVKIRFKRSKPNRAVVNFVLRRKYGKWFLRKWVTFWHNRKIESYPTYVVWFIALAIFYVFYRCADIMATPRNYVAMYLWMYPYYFVKYKIYDPYYLGPLVDYNLTGMITWKLFIAPATGLLLILWLLRINSQYKKQRRKTHDP